MIVNKKGFTLMELLAVIVVLAILIILAFPSVIKIMNNAKLNAFIDEYNSVYKIYDTAIVENYKTTLKGCRYII